MESESSTAQALAPATEPERVARGARRSERETAIIAAAIEEFRSSGLTNTRLEDVATRAGVAKGTIYLYFDNKEDLFKAAVRSLIHPTFERMETRIAEYEGPTEALLREAIRTMYADMCAKPETRELLRLMIAEGHRIPELVEFYHSETAGRGLAMLKMIVWRGVALGEFRRTPALEFPYLLVAPCKAAVSWQLVFGDTHAIELDRYADAHAEFVLAALRAPGTAGA